MAIAVALSWLIVFSAGAEAKTRPRVTRGPAKRGASADTNQVLVQIGREAITRADVQHRIDSMPEQFRSNYASPEGRQQLLDRMVEEKVWLTLAVSSGIANRPQVQQQLEQQRRDLLVRTYLNEVMAANAAPTDSEAHAYYDAHLADYRVPATLTARHIQTKTESDAKRVKQWARGKQDWNALVKRYSADTLTRANGGSLGTITREGVFPALGPQKALADSAFALDDGQVGGPYQTDKGWHVLKVENKKPESLRPFDQVRQVIVRQLGSTRSQDFYKAKLDSARRALGVQPDSTAIKGFLSLRKTAREMFNEAQAITAPDARITAYHQLLGQYPESDVSPQAQFMIGFIYSEELKKYDEAEKAFHQLLQTYPQAELAPSAQWMLAHMRDESAPTFVNMDGDSAQALPPAKAILPANRLKPWSPPAKGDSARGAARRP